MPLASSGACAANRQWLPLRCIFCRHESDKQFAVTVEHLDGKRERVVGPLCIRCNLYLGKAGSTGLLIKTTGERWFRGHVHGGSMKIDAPWIRDPKWPRQPRRAVHQLPNTKSAKVCSGDQVVDRKQDRRSEGESSDKIQPRKPCLPSTTGP